MGKMCSNWNTLEQNRVNVKWTINAANHLHVFSYTSHTLPQMNHAKLGNEIMSVSSDNVAAAVIYSL